MNDDYDIPISINDTIISLSAQIEGLKKQRDSLLRNCIYCDKCNKYYDKTSNCISSGIETRKVIRYNGDLEKGYTEMEILFFHAQKPFLILLIIIMVIQQERTDMNK